MRKMFTRAHFLDEQSEQSTVKADSRNANNPAHSHDNSASAKEDQATYLKACKQINTVSGP